MPPDSGTRRLRTFTQKDAPEIIDKGARMLKLPNPVYMLRQDDMFDVETNEGMLSGQAGDFVAHDPISGHVWPVAASYVEQHYRPAPDSQ
ncbi:MAG: hypothetical protein V4502_08190 [Pseudomonadota bacterium]